MIESVAQKKQRILGNSADGSPEVLRAIRAGQWTVQDASRYREYASGKAEPLKSHAGRIKATMEVATRTIQK